jgi:hypothetical protein
MGRLAHSWPAAVSLLLLAACAGGGGTGFGSGGSNTISNIQFSSTSAESGTFKLSTAATVPLTISAIATRISGTSLIVPDQTFTWTANYSPTGTQYNNENNLSASSDVAFCYGSATAVPPPTLAKVNPIGFGGLGVTTASAGVSNVTSVLQQPQANAIQNGGASNYSGAATNTIEVVPVPSTVWIAAGVTPPPASYCLTLVATHPQDGTIGTVTVFVGPS